MDCDWTQIRSEYITDSTSSYRKLAEKYEVPFSNLKRRAKAEEWTKLRAQAEHEATTKAIEEKVDRATRLMDVTDKLLTKIEEVVETLFTEENPLDKSALRQISGALKDIKDIQGVKSERDIREQEARIRNLERQAEATDDGDKEIVIRIAGNASEYCE